MLVVFAMLLATAVPVPVPVPAPSAAPLPPDQEVEAWDPIGTPDAHPAPPPRDIHDDNAQALAAIMPVMGGVLAGSTAAVLAIGITSVVPGALPALLVFAAAEWAAPHFGVWRPLGVRTWQGVAHYVLLPELLLGWAAAWAYREVGSAGVLMRLMGAAAVSVFYTGALIVSYFLMQRAGF